MRQKKGKPSAEHDGKFPIREEGRHRIEVHVAGVCVRSKNGQWEVLIAKRSPRRALILASGNAAAVMLNKAKVLRPLLSGNFSRNLVSTLTRKSC